MIQQDKLENRLLRSLSPEDFSLLQPDLERRSLKLREALAEPGEPIRNAYFPESGIVSLVTPGEDPTEVGIVGREGFVGVQIVLGVEDAPWRTFGQIAGEGHILPTAHLARALAKSTTLRDSLSRYVYLTLVQATETAYANAHYTVEQRLARWILLCQNRVGDELELTHEFIAMMLGGAPPRRDRRHACPRRFRSDPREARPDHGA